MKAKIYSYKNCDTCRKALKFLVSKNIAFEEVDITLQAPSKAELKAMQKKYDGQIRKLFNSSGQAYKELRLSESLPTMSENQALDLLTSNGRLVKRPFLLLNGEGVAVGFKEADWARYF